MPEGGLGNATGLGSTDFAKVRIHDVVAGIAGRAPGVSATHIGEGWVGQVAPSIRFNLGWGLWINLTCIY